jgi:hypothetical protein
MIEFEYRSCQETGFQDLPRYFVTSEVNSPC